MLFHLVLWSHALYCLDILFDFSYDLYIALFVLTQAYYFSLLAYLYTW